jgi:photosystem II stability/assembly factor-like uncharacterized protein
VRHASWLALLASLALLAGLLAGCSSSDGRSASYGGSQNHVHDILALHDAPQTVLLATHIGLYRTADSGRTWTEVAGGQGQAMDGLMLFKLVQSPVDTRRVYVLAVPRPDNPNAARATPGVYASADAGRTWKLASPLSAFPTQQLFTIGAGASSPGQLFAIIPGLGQHGLYGSDDGGAHWKALAPLPASGLNGIFGVPARPHRVLEWSVAAGLFLSDDGGQSWRPATGIQGGIYSVSQAGMTIYAIGDSGVFVSRDAGDSFTLADSADMFSAVVASASSPATAYAITGTAVYVTADMGRTWKLAADTTRHPTVLSVDPASADTAFVALSYPVGVDMTTTSGAAWKQVLP